MINEFVTADDVDSEHYPSEITLEWWKEWAQQQKRLVDDPSANRWGWRVEDGTGRAILYLAATV